MYRYIKLLFMSEYRLFLYNYTVFSRLSILTIYCFMHYVPILGVLDLFIKLFSKTYFYLFNRRRFQRKRGQQLSVKHLERLGRLPEKETRKTD